MNDNLPAVTKESAIEKLREMDNAESRAILDYVQSLESKNVVAIGTDNAFALTDQDGQIKAFKTVLELSVNEGTLVKIGSDFKSYVAPVAISAQGYEKWAEKTGASVIFPKDVLVGEELKPNPYAERDIKNGRILAVHARAVAFKYSPMGLPQVCDWSTIFDVPSYRMIDLLAKAKKTKQAFRLLPDGMEPEKSKKGHETWAKYPFDEATNLWLDTSHDEVLDWFKSIINREKKAMDFAQTFARRNALKHLSGLQKPPNKQNQWSFPVLAWRPTGDNIVKWDASQYAQLQDRVSSVIEGDKDFSSGEVKQLEVKKGSETVSQELDDQEISEDVNPGDSQDVEESENTTEKKSEPKVKNQYSKEVNQLITIKSSFPAQFTQAMETLVSNKELSLNSNVMKPEEMSPEQAISVSKEVNSIVDSGNQD